MSKINHRIYWYKSNKSMLSYFSQHHGQAFVQLVGVHIKGKYAGIPFEEGEMAEWSKALA